ADEYNVFSESSNQRIVDTCLNLCGAKAPAKIADLGCGSGIFSSILSDKGFDVIGVDISPGMIKLAQEKFPKSKYRTEFIVGDVESLPFADASFDAILLSGLLHHLPDPSLCIKEVYRILKPGGVFTAFDPNRENPFMYLYRDKSSPFYSSKGVTANERPVLAQELAMQFSEVGFEVKTEFISNLQYRYIASAAMRVLLPVYNYLDAVLFSPKLLRTRRAFVITAGRKPCRGAGEYAAT
ncbi:MAG: class I SAM-dependent methyltransferase, partial [Pseudobdellovibrionaceae bacterium]